MHGNFPPEDIEGVRAAGAQLQSLRQRQELSEAQRRFVDTIRADCRSGAHGIADAYQNNPGAIDRCLNNVDSPEDAARVAFDNFMRMIEGFADAKSKLPADDQNRIREFNDKLKNFHNLKSINQKDDDELGSLIGKIKDFAQEKLKSFLPGAGNKDKTIAGPESDTIDSVYDFKSVYILKEMYGHPISFTMNMVIPGGGFFLVAAISVLPGAFALDAASLLPFSPLSKTNTGDQQGTLANPLKQGAKIAPTHSGSARGG